MKKLTFAILFSALSICYSMSQNKADILKGTIDDQLEVLSNYSYPNSDNLDPDSLASLIIQNLETFANQVGIDHFKDQYASLVDSATSTGSSTFSIITVSYDSGGSARLIPHSLIIKQDNGIFKFYNMSKYEASFYEFNQLKDNLYLCFASIPGSGSCMNTGIYVFDFDDLSKSDNFSICNADMQYDPNTKILTMIVEETTFLNENDFKEGTKVITDKENGTTTIMTRFDGTRFVNP